MSKIADMSSQPVVIMLVGLPCSGKSTWTRAHLPKMVRISTDDHVLERSQATGIDYQEGLQKFYQEAEIKARLAMSDAIAANQDVVIDQANLTRSSRANKLAVFPAHYARIACFFEVPVEIAIERNAIRKNKGGHWVPEAVIREMAERLEAPFEPVFDEVIEIPFASLALENNVDEDDTGSDQVSKKVSRTSSAFG